MCVHAFACDGEGGQANFTLANSIPSPSIHNPELALHRNSSDRPRGQFRGVGPPWELASIGQVPSGRWARMGQRAGAERPHGVGENVGR